MKEKILKMLAEADVVYIDDDLCLSFGIEPKDFGAKEKSIIFYNVTDIDDDGEPVITEFLVSALEKATLEADGFYVVDSEGNGCILHPYKMISLIKE
jgi:hypothetical protein